MNQRKAFTLVEILIVAAVIAVLCAIAIPNFTSSRGRTSRDSCLRGLKALRSAKDQFAYDRNLRPGDSLDAQEAWASYSRNPFPTCPAGGVITAGNVGQDPTCSLSGGSFPHALPTVEQSTDGTKLKGKWREDENDD
ncbi:MAG: type II secretion system protein [Armatimonadetes bacterium]|nr:type II secretion system protein [Armatimonadota bacterium]